MKVNLFNSAVNTVIFQVERFLKVINDHDRSDFQFKQLRNKET